MAKLTHRPAASLLEMAKNKGNLEEIYEGAVELSQGKDIDAHIPEDLVTFLNYMEEKDVQPTIKRFVHMAREELNILTVEAVSAVPMSSEHLALLESQVIKLVRKRVNITNTIDHSIIGGLRIIIGNFVIDNSIKTQLAKIKKELYKGVYFKDEIEPSKN